MLILFFVNNIEVNAQEESSCSSLLKTYSSDVLEKRGGANGTRLDIADSNFSGVTNVKKFDQINIKREEKECFGIKRALELKNTSIIPSEVFTQENMKIALDNISITGNGKNMVNNENISAYNYGFNQAIWGVKQGGFFLVKDGKINVSNIYGLVMESLEGVFIPSGATLYGVLDGKPLYGLWDWRYSGVIFKNSDIAFNGRETRGFYLKGNPSQEGYIEGEMVAALGGIQIKKTNFKVSNDAAIYYR